MIKGINLGSGGQWYESGWVGLDEINGEILDENSILPLSDNSVKNAYSCHFFEHIDDKTSMNLFNEIYRVLEPGGVFRIVVPDFELIHKTCLESGMKIFNDIGFTGRPEWGRNNIEFNVANCLFHYIANYDDGIEGTPKFYRGPPKIPKEEANKIIHMNTKDLCKYLYDRIPTHDNIRTQHINFWNVEKFKKYFKNFDSFKISSHAKSINPEFNSNMFDNWKDRSRISLYVEGVK